MILFMTKHTSDINSLKIIKNAMQWLFSYNMDHLWHFKRNFDHRLENSKYNSMENFTMYNEKYRYSSSFYTKDTFYKN